MIKDLEKIVATVLANDPSFRSVKPAEIEDAVREARQQAAQEARDKFLLSLMRLLALPGNGHTRLIPNNAISVLPLRFVTIGTSVRLLDAADIFADAIGSELVSINRVPLRKVHTAAKKLLAGTRQRQLVIGPILYVWPSALKHLGVALNGETIEYGLRSKSGVVSTLSVDAENVVPGGKYYPRNEHGKADPSWSPSSFVTVNDFGQLGLHIVLSSFFDASNTILVKEIGKAAGLVKSRPDAPLLIDVRGNTGGNFLRALSLIDAISTGAVDRRVGLLIDKFTFSAAIVFVAILKHRLAKRLILIGEDMGDGLTFFAEGGTIDLPSSGACVRYSTALHDWAGGRIDETTPDEIAEKIVSVGTLKLDRPLIVDPDNNEPQDQLYRSILSSLAT